MRHGVCSNPDGIAFSRIGKRAISMLKQVHTVLADRQIGIFRNILLQGVI